MNYQHSLEFSCHQQALLYAGTLATPNIKIVNKIYENWLFIRALLITLIIL
jgi:hypothetical protein